MKPLVHSPTWRADLDALAQMFPEDLIPRGTVLVTGATGLVGSALVDLLLALRDRRGAPGRIVAAGRSHARLAQRFGTSAGLAFLDYDATKPLVLTEDVDAIVHAASNASPELYVQDPCGTLSANIDGVRGILESARRTANCRVLYVSSSEVYGIRTNGGPAREDDYGRVDPLSPRASYAEAKRAAEAVCAAYAAQYGVHVAIVRPGHVYGPTATPADRRVSSVFAFRAARGEPLVLTSAGTQLRSYCHCLDCATAMLTVLARGARATAYNISNPASILTIREMATHFAAAGGTSISFGAPTTAEKVAFNPMPDSSLAADRLLALGWQGHFPAPRGFERTVNALRDILA